MHSYGSLCGAVCTQRSEAQLIIQSINETHENSEYLWLVIDGESLWFLIYSPCEPSTWQWFLSSNQGSSVLCEKTLSSNWYLKVYMFCYTISSTGPPSYTSTHGQGSLLTLSETLVSFPSQLTLHTMGSVLVSFNWGVYQLYYEHTL